MQNGDAGEDRLGFYTGDIGKNLVADLRELGGIITEEDMRCICIVRPRRIEPRTLMA